MENRRTKAILSQISMPHSIRAARHHQFIRWLVAAIIVMHYFMDDVEALILQKRFPLQRILSTAVTAGVFALTVPSSTLAAQFEWNLGNGVVRLEDTLAFPNQKPLHRPRLLGSGGGGAVFSFDESNVVVKVSWTGSAESVERECSVLKTLENSKVEGVERCLGQARYLDDNRRVMIAMEPLMEDAVASPMEVDKALRLHAVHCIVRTMVQMLAANVATVDVQPLISKQTGNVIFIDLTEAKELKPPLSFLDVALISSFCTEMAALIPDSLLPVASMALLDELHALEKRGVMLSKEVCDALCAQPFASEEILDYIEKNASASGK